MLRMKIVKLLLLAFMFQVSCVGDPSIRTDAKKFNSQEWKTCDINGGQRHHMFDDLKANYLVIGMKKSAVIALLGSPDDTECGGIITKQDSVMPYRVSTGLDPCSLDIILDKSKKVKSFSICCS